MMLLPKVVFGMPADLEELAEWNGWLGIYVFAERTVYTRNGNHGIKLFRTLLHEFLHHLFNIARLKCLHNFLDEFDKAKNEWAPECEA